MRTNYVNIHKLLGFPHSPVDKEFACDAGDPGLIPGLGRSSGEGNGNALQCSCLENPMERGAWRATVHGVMRVVHSLATKPPPYKLLTQCRAHLSYSINNSCYSSFKSIKTFEPQSRVQLWLTSLLQQFTTQ